MPYGKKKPEKPLIERRRMARYLSPLDVWAIAFGCSVGWGAFVMPATTFLPIAGPAGSLVAMLVSTALMLVIGYNYAWLMRNRPRKGGVYTYTKEAFGRDHAFLCSWFLSLSYLTVVFLNATALYIISRVVFENVPPISFQTMIGNHVLYPGEIALSVLVLALVGALLILKKPFMQTVQRVLAVVLFVGVVLLFLVCLPHLSRGSLLHSFGTGGFGAAGGQAAGASAFAGMEPSAQGAAAGGGIRAAGAVMTIVLLAPWAFVGFDVASLETPHFDFPIRWSGRIIAASILCAGLVYTLMTFISASFRPPVYGSWQAYIADLDTLTGVAGVPTFYAAREVLGGGGLVLVTVTALAAILTGVIGAYRATVRMLSTMAEDRILTREFNGTTFSIIFIMAVSSMFTFFGRNTLNWFVELTSFGATIGFAYTSAAAARIGRREGTRAVQGTGIIGAVFSGIFALVQLASRVASVETMGAPSFLLLAVWCLLGFIFYWRTMRQSELSDFEGVTTSSAVLFCLLFYSILRWFLKRLAEAAERMGLGQGTAGEAAAIDRAILMNGLVMLLFVVIGLFVMLLTQGWLRRRQAFLEREKIHAEESSKAKSQFLFNMSHDIRTPLNAIIGYTHLAGLEQDLSPRVREYIEKIDISGKHLLTLINDVLEMSRIESGKMELEDEPGDIEEALQTAFEMFQDQMEEKKIGYSLDIRNVKDPYVCFDRNRFLRVILNLVSNACKFTPEGGSVSVRLAQVGIQTGEEAARLAQAGAQTGEEVKRPAHAGTRTGGEVKRPAKAGAQTGGEAKGLASAGSKTGGEAKQLVRAAEPPVYGVYEIRVKDSGIGMTKEFAETVFEAFARERTSTVSRIQGTGLGMAITKSIVDAMQGSIDVETAPGQGTEFIIRLPYPVCEEKLLQGESSGTEGAEAKGHAAEAAALSAEAKEHLAEAGAPSVEEKEHAAEAGALPVVTKERPAEAGAPSVEEKEHAAEAGAPSVEKKEHAAEVKALPVGAEAPPAGAADVRQPAAAAAIAETEAAPAETMAAAPAETEAGSRSLIRLLVAEDMEINRQILCMLLQNIGYEADVAVDGKEAFEKVSLAEPGEYGAVLMDIQMPFMDGYEATEKIRQLPDPAIANIPIIAVTANAFGEDVRKAQAVGMNAHIAKPIDPDQLEKVLREILRQEK